MMTPRATSCKHWPLLDRFADLDDIGERSEQFIGFDKFGIVPALTGRMDSEECPYYCYRSGL